MAITLPAAFTRRGLLAGFAATTAAAPPSPAAAPAARRRVGAVAYAYVYSIGLFEQQKRPGERMDVFQFVEATRQAGGNAAQIYWTMLEKLNAAEFQRLRSLAAGFDVKLELHGGMALSPGFDRALDMAAALGAKVVGCSFGFRPRPGKMATLDAWDAHLAQCRTRLRDLVGKARARGVVLGVENHLDFTLEELVDLMKFADSPHAGIIFDVGNWIGTLDDPIEAAAAAGRYVVGTHFKDFAIEEVTRGFRFTMVPIGAGSLRLPEIAAALEKNVPPGSAYCIELINGQQFEVPWLEDSFWPPFRNKTARQVAATLRHVRSKAIDYGEYKPSSELDRLSTPERMKFEQERIAVSISRLNRILDRVQSA